MSLTASSTTGISIERQERILAHIQSNPLASYVFSGPPGVGKTTLLHEVERLARVQCPRNYAVYSRTATQYQRDTTTAVRGEHVSGLVRAQSLKTDAAHGVRWGIFLDDVDKLTGSEFIRVQLFDLFNAACEERNPSTQVVMTTNMSKVEFARFFGDHIAWRIFKKCAWVAIERAA